MRRSPGPDYFAERVAKAVAARALVLLTADHRFASGYETDLFVAFVRNESRRLVQEMVARFEGIAQVGSWAIFPWPVLDPQLPTIDAFDRSAQYTLRASGFGGRSSQLPIAEAYQHRLVQDEAGWRCIFFGPIRGDRSGPWDPKGATARHDVRWWRVRFGQYVAWELGWNTLEPPGDLLGEPYELSPNEEQAMRRMEEEKGSRR